MRVFVAVPEIEAAYVDLTDPVTIDVQSLARRGVQGHSDADELCLGR